MTLPSTFSDSLIKKMNEHRKGVALRCDGFFCVIGCCQRVWDAASRKGGAER